MTPVRRTEGLLVEELAEETIVFDRVRQEAHCLSRVAACAWRHCDGRTTAAAIAARLRAELGHDADEAAVGLILDRLEAAHLLGGRPARRGGGPRPTRRAAGRVAAAGLAGLVVSIVVPTPAAAATLLANGLPCTSNSQCASGCCAPGAHVCGITENCLQ